LSQVKYTLPFEVVGGESGSKKKIIQAGLKRVEVLASSEKAAEVLAAIKDKGFEATLYDSKGYGEQKDRVRSGRGTSEA